MAASKERIKKIISFTEPKQCLVSQFQCNSTKCIPYLWQCDGDNDCGDWSDESSCDGRDCKEGYMKCETSGKCIPKAWECDAERDCGEDDDSDEKQEKCCKLSLFPIVHDIIVCFFIYDVIWAATRENMSSGFPTKRDTKQSP